MSITHPNTLKKTALTAALLLELASASQAAIINVNNTSCQLANAITSANNDSAFGGCTSGSGDDVIELPTNSIISIGAALPTIANNLTINANGTTLSRDLNSVDDFSVLFVHNLNTLPRLTLNNATVSGGSNTGNYGGGIFVFNGNLTLNNSTITENVGGGVVLTRVDNSFINNSTISNNLSAVAGNYYGGGLAINGGNVFIESSTISDNTVSSGLGGAGLYLTSYAGTTEVTINNSTISGNSSAFNGGGISHFKESQSDLVVNISNSTIINNHSDSSGGGILNDYAALTIHQSIISGNSSVNVGHNIQSVDINVTISDNNLLGFNNDAGVYGVTLGAADIVPSNSNLDEIIETTLADNGGITKTHNLVMNSPAIDTIAAGNCLNAVDQADNSRPLDGDGDSVSACDMGAMEFVFNSDLIFKNGFD